VSADDTAQAPFFSFDTSAFINGRNDIYRPSTFGALWDQISAMIAAGRVRAVDEVKRELQRKDDVVLRWARSQRGLFVPLSSDIQRKTREVLAAHPRLISVGGTTPRSTADPFVIALAWSRGGTVVTQEEPRNLGKPRIPDVCDAVGVRWMSLPEFVDDRNWQISIDA
jgi:hypothetical protein